MRSAHLGHNEFVVVVMAEATPNSEGMDEKAESEAKARWVHSRINRAREVREIVPSVVNSTRASAALLVEGHAINASSRANLLQCAGLEIK